MAFLRVNGIEISVANDSAEVTPEVVGESGRAPDGSLWVHRTSVKGGYSFSTTPRTAKEAIALTMLLLGEGHVWPFSSALGLYSSRGALITSSGAAIARTGAAGKFGTDSATVPNGVTLRSGVFYSTTDGRRLPTLSFWYSTNGSTWTHRVYRATGTQWYTDGVAGAAPSGITASYSATYGWQIENATGGQVWIDDLWICPYDWPATWPAFVFGYANPVGLCPRVKADGDGIEANLVTTAPDYIGDQVKATPVQGVLTSGFENNLHAVSFSLSEI